MAVENLVKKAGDYLHYLCATISSRRVGSSGNREATDFFARVMQSYGFQTECPAFDCMDWTSEGAWLKVNDQTFEVHSSPYSLGSLVTAPLVMVCSIKELETSNIQGKVLLLRGEIAREQLMPKNFKFYNPEEHQHIYHLLESRKPAAILTATERNPGVAGSIYPCPLFEDGDFDFPSVFMTVEEGEKLVGLVGKLAQVASRAQRIPSTGCNVVARKGGSGNRRLVFTAHIDARAGTPGALDNASGTSVLLLLAEMLKDYQGKHAIELVAINGEDYYANPGELLYLEQNRDRLHEILLNINIDDAGYREGRTAYSLYECPQELAEIVRKVLSTQPGFFEGQPWPQGDHMIFVQNQVPAVAITSENFMQVLGEITHSTKDVPDLVDCRKLVEIAVGLRGLIDTLNEHSGS